MGFGLGGVRGWYRWGHIVPVDEVFIFWKGVLLVLLLAWPIFWAVGFLIVVLYSYAYRVSNRISLWETMSPPFACLLD